MKQLGINSTLQQGDIGHEVRNLYIFLQELGYLPGEPMKSLYKGFHKVPTTPKESLKFDDELEEAISMYQQFHNLKVTGRLDETTLELMKKPRCAYPDVVRHEYVTVEAWEKRDVTYRLNASIFKVKIYTGEVMPAEAIGNAFLDAFKSWQKASKNKLRIKKVDVDADIEVYGYDFGTSSKFGGTYPPQDGDIYMDFDSTWTYFKQPPTTGLDFFAGVLHEVGHAVGLDHVSDSTSIMYPSIDVGEMKGLSQDDIDGMRALYP